MKSLTNVFAVALSVMGILLPAHAIGADESGEQPARPIPKELRLLYAALMTVQETAAQPVTLEELARGALNGMAKAADEDNEYYSQAEYENYTSGRSEGAVGLELASRGDALMIISPIVGGPADLAGLLPKDRIVSINEEIVVGKSVAKALDLLRGPIGSKVRISVSRGDAKRLLTLEVERGKISVSSVSTRRLHEDILLLKVTALRTDALTMVARHLQQEWNTRPFKGLVLDLQHNPGGLLQHAIGLAALFLPPDKVVAKTMGQSNDAKAVYFARPQFYLRSQEADPLRDLPGAIRSIPLVVLVDAGTASGAEVVAGALQQHARAKIIGHQTFGRAKIQTLRPLPGYGALRITSGLIYAPNDKSYEAGIQPDVVLPPDTSQMAAADEALLILKKTLAH
ncbi:MAG: S41 family peptidase [Aquabacterium sp.]|uniref:S41 family peptidase n=1 Tax=Aquabacterium sp. TaxID=1872578 RepID=UPI00271B346D|nr:S41 family peptidase [Aquabacterium sp.]MDO9005406.1 S41 family peptidase [Aquabacterium sp.]